MDGQQLGAIGEERLDLDEGEHLGHAFHHLGATQDPAAQLDDLGVRTARTRLLEQLITDQGDRLRMIEPQPPRAAAAGQLGHREDRQAILLAGRQLHRTTSAQSRVTGRESVGYRIMPLSTMIVWAVRLSLRRHSRAADAMSAGGTVRLRSAFCSAARFCSSLNCSPQRVRTRPGATELTLMLGASATAIQRVSWITAALQHRNVPLTLTAMILSQDSSSMLSRSGIGTNLVVPALLTSTSSRPSSSTV